MVGRRGITLYASVALAMSACLACTAQNTAKPSGSATSVTPPASAQALDGTRLESGSVEGLPEPPYPEGITGQLDGVILFSGGQLQPVDSSYTWMVLPTVETTDGRYWLFLAEYVDNETIFEPAGVPATTHPAGTPEERSAQAVAAHDSRPRPTVTTGLAGRPVWVATFPEMMPVIGPAGAGPRDPVPGVAWRIWDADTGEELQTSSQSLESTVSVPEIEGMTVLEASRVLAELDLASRSDGEAEDLVWRQDIPVGVRVEAQSIVYLSTAPPHTPPPAGS